MLSQGVPLIAARLKLQLDRFAENFGVFEKQPYMRFGNAEV
jgi:hypothetical protein